MTTCDNEETAEETRTTYCDRNRVDNVWVEGADENGDGGICLLDTLTEDQVVYSVQRSERARVDLCKVTSDPGLLNIAAKTPRLPTGQKGDKLQTEINRNADSIPYYSQFKGKPPWSG
jgi:hypothetical protein